MRSGDTDVSMEGHLGAKTSWCSPKAILTKTWACPSCWISWCIWYCYFSCIFLICVRIFLKLFVKTLVDRSQDVEKCLQNAQLPSLSFKSKAAGIAANEGTWFRAKMKIIWEKNPKLILVLFLIDIDCSTKENGSSCQRFHVPYRVTEFMKQLSDPALSVHICQGTWLPAPDCILGWILLSQY